MKEGIEREQAGLPFYLPAPGAAQAQETGRESDDETMTSVSEVDKDNSGNYGEPSVPKKKGKKAVVSLMFSFVTD